LNVPLHICPKNADAERQILNAGIMVHLKATNIGSDMIGVALMSRKVQSSYAGPQSLSPGASKEVYYGSLSTLFSDITCVDGGLLAFSGHGSVKLDFRFEHMEHLNSPVEMNIRTDPSNPVP
jgi:hypothetical protein